LEYDATCDATRRYAGLTKPIRNVFRYPGRHLHSVVRRRSGLRRIRFGCHGTPASTNAYKRQEADENDSNHRGDLCAGLHHEYSLPERTASARASPWGTSGEWKKGKAPASLLAAATHIELATNLLASEAEPGAHRCRWRVLSTRDICCGQSLVVVQQN